MQQPARKQMNREFENKELTARKGLKNLRARSKLLERNWLAKGRDPLRAGRAAKDRELMARKPAKQGRAKGREHAKGRKACEGQGAGEGQESAKAREPMKACEGRGARQGRKPEPGKGVTTLHNPATHPPEIGCQNLLRLGVS